MKKSILKAGLLFVMFLGIAEIGFSQKTKKGTTVRKGTKRGASTTKKATKGKVVDASAGAVAEAPAMNSDSLPVKAPIASMENDNAIERLLVKDRTPLAYEHLREDDALYKQRVWRDIDTREKMNQPFLYAAEEDNGSQKFIDILLNAIQKDPNVVAYSALDDRFTNPMTKAGLRDLLVGKPTLERVPDRVKDKDGSLGIFKDSLIVPDFNSTKITRFRIKEDWVFDKESSRMFVRILGIAPIQIDTVSIPGEVLEMPLFWVYYPKLRATLAKYEAYNGKNFGARPTWEELFEGRMFSSFIVKSTIDNPKDIFLKDIPGLKENGILRLWEGDNVKKQIFDYEQNLWSY